VRDEGRSVFATFEEAREFAEKALLKTGLFQRASGLGPLAQLKASARNVLLFASYAGACYLHDESSTIVPAGASLFPDGEILSFAYPPLLFAVNESTNALCYPWNGLSFGKAWELREETVRALLEGEKYLVILGKPYVDYLHRKVEWVFQDVLRGAPVPSWWPEHGVVTDEWGKRMVLKEQLQRLLALCREEGLAPTDVLVYTVDLGAPGYGPGESFYGYLAGVEFVRRGYLVSRTNLTGIGPTDDLFAFRPQDLERGAFLLELTLMAELPPTKSTEGETVFMEIEDTPREISQRHGLPKVIDYLGSFTQSYIVAPFIEHYAATEKCPAAVPPCRRGPQAAPPAGRSWAEGWSPGIRRGTSSSSPPKGRERKGRGCSPR
jgi:hypothetical protein